MTRGELPASELRPSPATGLWIHEDDLSPETSPLAGHAFRAILVSAHRAEWDGHGFPEGKRQWLLESLGDTSRRAAGHWKTPAPLAAPDDLAWTLSDWAKAQGVDQVATLRPDTGPLDDALPSISASLAAAGIHLALIDRPRDLVLRSLATGGFFQFWERLQKRGLLPGQGPRAETMEFPFINDP